jgi:hypothetical protein
MIQRLCRTFKYLKSSVDRSKLGKVHRSVNLLSLFRVLVCLYRVSDLLKMYCIYVGTSLIHNFIILLQYFHVHSIFAMDLLSVTVVLHISVTFIDQVHCHKGEIVKKGAVYCPKPQYILSV